MHRNMLLALNHWSTKAFIVSILNSVKQNGAGNVNGIKWYQEVVSVILSPNITIFTHEVAVILLKLLVAVMALWAYIEFLH